MRQTRGAVATTLTIAWMVALGGAGQQPIGPLAAFEPLVGTSWIGRFASSPAPPFDHWIAWSTLLGGQGVQWSKRVEQMGFSMETFFYWDGELDAIAFIQLASNGIHGKGVVEITDGGFALVGIAMQPTGIVSFRQTFERLSEGVLEDRYFRRTGDGWLTEHVIVYRLDLSE